MPRRERRKSHGAAQPNRVQDDGKLTKILAIVFVMGVGGAGAFFYFYIYKPKQSEPEVSKENLEYEALPTKNEDEEAGQDAETEE